MANSRRLTLNEFPDLIMKDGTIYKNSLYVDLQQVLLGVRSFIVAQNCMSTGEIVNC